ncbi:het-domain-containing [Fusarium sporotrichioides]|uniref:Het-domain-containing n=1 Tax=Fusarium sporotrichioides TaxID=5514 RepID=A0A395SGQ8_FUSSP|nr:het-domain-containing [Fusarium sporotrichioides]
MANSSMSITSPPCTVCRFENWNSHVERSYKPDQEELIEEYKDLQKSALLGCPGCIILHEAWAWCIPGPQLRPKAWLSFNIDTSRMYFHLFPHPSGVLDVDIFTLPGQPRLKHIASASLLPPSTELRHNLSRIQSWIEACERSHKRCSANPEFTPFRLLDLQPGTQDFIQLVNETNVRYACLSHCWGSTRSKHLTKRDNIRVNGAGIPLLELPKTFQDAVYITKALGIRYLWIDTFCIIQDDEKDWETQASLMAAIYENAYITLAAGASDDDDGGFFSESHDAYTKPYKFHLDVDGIDHEFYMRYAVPHPGSSWPGGKPLPLMTRAWTLQERLLANRYLCFGHDEIFWECQEDVSCSCTIAEGPFNPCDGQPKLYRCQPLKYQCSLLENLSPNDLATLCDKLPALAGLAEKFQRVFDSSYLVGLWLNNLRQDMAWHTSGNDALFGRVRKGPSWSTFQVNATSIHQGTHGFNPHDYAEGSHLLIRGLIQAVSVQTNAVLDNFEKACPLARHCQVVEWTRRHSEHSQLLVRRFGSLVEPTEGRSSDRAAKDDSDLVETMYGTFFADYRFWEREEDLRETLQHVYFLLLGTENGFYPDDPLCIDGIVLKPRPGHFGETKDSYERIGWLQYCLASVTESEWTPRGTESTVTLF